MVQTHYLRPTAEELVARDIVGPFEQNLHRAEDGVLKIEPIGPVMVGRYGHSREALRLEKLGWG
jgi:hypothetical protein